METGIALAFSHAKTASRREVGPAIAASIEEIVTSNGTDIFTRTSGSRALTARHTSEIRDAYYDATASASNKRPLPFVLIAMRVDPRRGATACSVVHLVAIRHAGISRRMGA